MRVLVTIQLLLAFVDSIDPLRDPDLLVSLESPSGVNDSEIESPWMFLGIHPHAPISQEWFNLRNNGYEKYTELINSFGTRPITVAGDFNATQYSYWFRKIRKDFNLSFNTSIEGTAPSWLPQPLAITIDHLLHSDHWETMDREVGVSYGGAHNTVITKLAWRQ